MSRSTRKALLQQIEEFPPSLPSEAVNTLALRLEKAIPLDDEATKVADEWATNRWKALPKKRIVKLK